MPILDHGLKLGERRPSATVKPIKEQITSLVIQRDKLLAAAAQATQLAKVKHELDKWTTNPVLAN
jgi:hypothetical protein